MTTKHCIISLVHPLELRNAGQWVAFTRLEPFIMSILDTEYGLDRGAWPDSIKAFYRDLWLGELDGDIHRISNALPGHFDTRHAEMTKDPQSARFLSHCGACLGVVCLVP